MAHHPADFTVRLLTGAVYALPQVHCGCSSAEIQCECGLILNAQIQNVDLLSYGDHDKTVMAACPCAIDDVLLTIAILTAHRLRVIVLLHTCVI